MDMSALAVQLYSLREHPVTESLPRLAELGYQAVEPFAILDDPEGLRALLDRTGLRVWSAHAALLGGRRDEFAEAAHVLGLDTLVVPLATPEEFANREAVERTAEALNDCAAWAAGHGLRVGYHNHHWELSSQVDGRSALELLADLLVPEVFLEVDVYWAAVGGADVPALLRGLGDRVRFLHVKDGPATVEDPMTAVGSGVLPIPEILAAAPQARRVVELDRCAGDMWQAIADSRAYLEGLPA